MDNVPSPNGDNGRDDRGRFARGNSGGPGNPHAARVGAWRNALANAVSADDITEVVEQLVTMAKAGQPWAVVELLNRTCGKPSSYVEDGEDHDAVAAEIKEHIRRIHESLGLRN